jgi:hypothetical protein
LYLTAYSSSVLSCARSICGGHSGSRIFFATAGGILVKVGIVARASSGCDVA